MDILAFLKNRTLFIRSFYETAAAPFIERIRKIEEREPPYDAILCGEDTEPPFLAEWIEAEKGLRILGQTCLTMLSNSLKLYFEAWEKKFNFQWEKGERERLFKKGFVRGYRALLEQTLAISWKECSTDFDRLEQIALARNSDQHPQSITSVEASHHQSDAGKFSNLRFLGKFDRLMLDESDVSFLPLRVHVTDADLSAAIEEVELLVDWLEPRLIDSRHRQ